jgi:endogenous inhibitor of DNA gyrase (YacG/DUF329 family)
MLKQTFCPECGKEIDWRKEAHLQPFECPQCGATLKFSPAHPRAVQVVGAFLALLICRTAGLTGGELWLGAIILWVPMFMVVGFLATLILPYKLESYREPGLKLPRK